MSVRALVVRALDALEDGDLDLVRGCLVEAESMLERQEEGWVLLSDAALVPDMSVFDDDDEDDVR